MSSPGSDPLIGATLDGRFFVEKVIGRGGMGAVYLARHTLIERPVALKVLVGGADGAGGEAARRFVREAKNSFLLDHPNCVRVTDLGATGDGLLYLVMEHLDGRTLGAELTLDGPLSPARVLHIGAQIARALEHAHGHGFVHRDLKPDNIMLLVRDGDPDHVKVLDFGLAKAFDADVGRTAAVSITPLTRDGIVFGTPDYMAPEQALGRQVGPPADLYALGAVLYHAITGTTPFDGPNDMAILTAHVRAPLERPSARSPARGIPPAVDGVVQALMAKRPEDRPAGARAAVALLEEAARSVAAAPVVRSASETLDLGAAAPRPMTRAPSGDRGARERQGRSTAVLRSRRPRRAFGGVALALVGIAAVAVATRDGSPTDAAPGLAAAGPGAAELAVSSTGAVAPAAPGTGATEAAPGIGAAGAALAIGAAEAAPGTGATEAAQALVHPIASTSPRQGAVASSGPDAAPDPATGVAAPTPAAPAPRAADPAAARRAGALRHLRAAESARRDRNHLRQLVEADQALRLDPSSRRARELVGEALVATGDRTRGCAYLKSIRRAFEAARCGE